MKRPEPSPADNLRRKKAGKKVGTILRNYHKRRLGIDGVDWVRMELSYIDLNGYRQVARDQGYYSPKGGEQDYYYQGGIGMNSDDNQWVWFQCEERDARILREKREAEKIYCVTCGCDTTEGAENERTQTHEQE